MGDLRCLVVRACSGDLEAYGEIVRRFQDMAYGYAYSILGDFHLAEDAAQEAFLEAYRKLPDLRAPDAFAGWFRRIVFKHCDRLTRGRRIPTVPLDAVGEIASGGPGPDEATEAREMRDRVIGMVRSLPEKERVATTLFYIDGYSQKEVAEFLEVPVTTVKNRLHASRNRLKERMMDMVDGTLKSFPLPERFADVVAQMNFVTKRIAPLADSMRSLGDGEISVRSAELRGQLRKGEGRDSVRAEAFALVREACRRALGQEHYDVQLVAGMILDAGWVAEIASGEGKSIACYPAAYMAVLEGMRVHIATPNDYLAKRDAASAREVFALLGVTVGCVTADMPVCGEEAEGRRGAYRCDIAYGTAAAFGFDCLRDRIRSAGEAPLQASLDFAIIDEVDSVLIDEGRTPLIISEGARGDVDRYSRADAVARELIARSGDVVEADAPETTEFYGIDPKHRWNVRLTEAGTAAAQEIAGVGGLDEGPDAAWPHLIEQALRAHLLYEREREYVVQDDRVIILDGQTGRPTPGRKFSEGLHQAIEVKEGMEVTPETQAKATLLVQDHFRRYKKLAGMSGTVVSQATEFRKRYALEVAAVPTRRPVNRVDYEDRIYADADAMYEAIAEEVRHYSRDLRRPVLVGTTGIEASERLSGMLTEHHGIAHRVLNARPENAAREAEIVASAGQQHPRKAGSEERVGGVTIATEMAGRGTDIGLGPGVVQAGCRVPPAEVLDRLGVEADPLFPPGMYKCCMYCTDYDEATGCAHCFKPKIDPSFPRRGRTACREEPPCGLHVVGAGRHALRRIDNQLQNRAGRQGDPGCSRFFLCMDDALVGDAVEALRDRDRPARGDDMAVEDGRLSRAIARAQERAEARNFEIRWKLDRSGRE